MTHDELLSLWVYDPDTGEFRWRQNRQPNHKPGDLAGGPDPVRRGQTYWRIRLFGKRMAAHRLAWFYVRGTWPSGEIDHINGNAMGNRIVNLREVDRIENAQNLRKARADSASGLIGAMRASRGRFQALIKANGKRHYLGSFKTAVEAHEAYVAAKRRLHSTCTI